jgi:hypothetical protein
MPRATSHFRRTARRLRLTLDDSTTDINVPARESLTGYAGRQVFEQTGRVEDAARLLGSISLDTTAALIGHQWQPRKRPVSAL